MHVYYQWFICKTYCVFLECLDHLATMIKDKNTSICLPTIETACKKIAKSIGERDNSVRTSALNCLVAVFILHGDALFKFIDNVWMYLFKIY